MGANPAENEQAGPQTYPLHVIRDVRLFATGQVRGDKWTEQDVDAIVNNVHLLSKYLTPTVVIGHEEQQPLSEGMPATWADNSGQPAFGAVQNVRKVWDEVEGHKQPFPVGDLHDVPAWLAGLVKSKSYRTVSAELYPADQPPEGLPPEVAAKIQGPVFRRLALLGGDLPQWKTLGELPQPQLQRFVELAAKPGSVRLSRIQRLQDGRILLFSEVLMSKAAAKIKFKKFADLSAKSKATLKKFDDAQAPPPDGGSPAPAPSRDEMVAMLTEMGVDPAVLDKLDDAALAEFVRVAGGTQMSDAGTMTLNMGDGTTPSVPAPVANTPTPSPTPAPLPGDGRLPATVTLKYSEGGKTVEREVKLADLIGDEVKRQVAAEVKTFSDKADSALTRVDRIDADTRKASIQKFCEAHAKKIGGGELKDRVIDRLMRADHIKKFSDGAHKGKTELELQMEEIASGPDIANFSERLTNPANTGGAPVEVERVKRFSETVFKHDQKAADKYVKDFEEIRKKQPNFSATDYGVPEDVAA